MQILTLYIITAVIFLALDGIGLNFLIKPVFQRHIGHIMAENIRWAPAILFYLGYIMGVLHFVSIPALRSGAPTQALIGGALIGLMSYATYEFTNFATLGDWTWQQVILDTAWGTALTAVAAWAGVAIMLKMSAV
ncbi:DUF2177 family protein [Qingshengfaniella alkalisoli]|uniref:DUF2177 family protein n=1 Tax=Qingshengfaniella alkalisoli TaxID=2599296 RepID=A0A5B8I9K5_9RHOB|nr:DUF2177 family protein [Qingshengfaniella alkalisoli]QDY70599.1 DUF2177 family protein [Qingshengfaniella alkalisoli]